MASYPITTPPWMANLSKKSRSSNENNKNSGITIELFKYIVKDIVDAANIVTGKTDKADYTILNICQIWSLIILNVLQSEILIN